MRKDYDTLIRILSGKMPDKIKVETFADWLSTLSKVERVYYKSIIDLKTK